MGGIGQVASAGLQAYSAGMFNGAPSTSNLTMAAGSTLPGNTLDSSTMSSIYGGPSYEVVPGNFAPTLTTEGQINMPTQTNQSNQFSYENIYGNTPTYTLNSPFDKKKK